jgi:protein TonB
LIPLRVGHSVEPPQIVTRVDPAPVGLHGIVIVALIVDSNGNLCDAVIARGLNTPMDRAALAAVRQWKFKPALLNGTPRAAVMHVTVKF